MSSGRLDEKQRYRYRTEGFVVIEAVLTAGQIAQGRAIIDDLVEKSRSVQQSDTIFDLEDDHTNQAPHVRRIKSPAAVHSFFDTLLRSDAVLDIIEDLLGPDIRALGSKLNLKTGSGGSAVEWHQDFAFHPHTNDDIAAVAVAFDDSTVDNGCLYVLPGSHVGPMLDHHQDGRFVGAIDPQTAPVDLARAVPVELAAGSVSVHHGRVLHGSFPNSSSSPRRLLLWDVAAADAWPLYRGVDDLDVWNAGIVRGVATLEPRLAAIPVRVPLPLPTGTIFELQAAAAHKAFASENRSSTE